MERWVQKRTHPTILLNSGFLDAAYVGGGGGDALYTFMGGVPGGLRFQGGVNVPTGNRYPENPFGSRYGNNSSADYFAHSFVGAIIGADSTPPDAKMWMASVINLTAK